MDTLTIEFDDRPEKVVTQQSPVTLNEYFGVREKRDLARWSERETVAALYQAFAPFLISWDFAPPPTADGMADLDILLMFSIVDAWVAEVRNVDPPLGRRSSGGEASPEPSPSPKASPARKRSTRS